MALNLKVRAKVVEAVPEALEAVMMGAGVVVEAAEAAGAVEGVDERVTD